MYGPVCFERSILITEIDVKLADGTFFSCPTPRRNTSGYKRLNTEKTDEVLGPMCIYIQIYIYVCVCLEVGGRRVSSQGPGILNKCNYVTNIFL